MSRKIVRVLVAAVLAVGALTASATTSGATPQTTLASGSGCCAR
jgi:hypothetical protein